MIRFGLFGAGLLVLAISYLFQYTDFLFVITGARFSPEAHFIVNRVARIILNDLGTMAIVYAIFFKGGVLKIALLIQLIDLFILLPIYLAIKLPSEGVSELSTPFLSQFHRLIVNPVLLILLVPAIYYQNMATKPSKNENNIR